MKHGQEYASGNTSITRGCAWHVYPDPATPGVFAGDNPFGATEPPGPERTVQPADDVVDFWLIGKNTPGIHNAHEGHSFLVLTRDDKPPKVTAGWFVEPARLDESFQLDQRGDRAVRLVRIIRGAQPGADGLGVADCEFQVVRG